MNNLTLRKTEQKTSFSLARSANDKSVNDEDLLKQNDRFNAFPMESVIKFIRSYTSAEEGRWKGEVTQHFFMIALKGKGVHRSSICGRLPFVTT